MRSIPRIGLTGGIGSGKSTVAKLLRDRGAAIIDADAVARACTQAGGAAMYAIANTFGSEFVAVDGSLDRDRMRTNVFSRPQVRTQLETILHPIIDHEMSRQAALNRSGCTVFDIPLLVESKRWRHRLDRIAVIDCQRETQIRRVMARNGWGISVVEAVLAQQSLRSERLAAADLVLFNDTDDIGTLQDNITRLAPWFGL